MTTQAATPPVQPEYIRCKVASIDNKAHTIRLITPDAGNEEYVIDHLTLDPAIVIGSSVDVIIVRGRIQDIRLASQSPMETPKPQVPPREITGDIGIIGEKGLKIGSEMFYFNGVSIEGFKSGQAVRAKVSGDNLLSIELAPKASPEIRKGHGIIKVLDLQKPQLSYEFTWSDKATGEKKSAIQDIFVIPDDLKEVVGKFKPGDKVNLKFSGRGQSATLHEITEDTYKGGRGNVKSPEERYSITLQSSFAQTREALRDYHTINGSLFDGTFSEYMSLIRSEALITGQRIYLKAKEAT